MAQPGKYLKKSEVSRQQTQLHLVPPFSHNPFWQSSLFNEVYLLNDVPVKYRDMWTFDEAGPLYLFCNDFRNLCEELKDADLDSWSERNTINRLIKPVLKMLGYTGTTNQEPWAEDEPFSVQERGELKTYKPDLIIVDDPKELKYIERKKGEEKLHEARASVIVPIEAKYWGRIEDIRQNGREDAKRADKKEQHDATRSLDFDEQCLKYMEILNKDYGILTDGKTWRLYNRELSQDSYHRNFQFNLGHLMKHVRAGLDKDPRDYETFIENAKYFFHLFSKQSHFPDNNERRFVDELLEYSKKYVTQAEENLKERFVKAMAHACNGYLRATGKASSKADLTAIRNIAESQLFNILFIKHCESRNILPLKQSPEYRKISISNMIDKLEHYSPEKEEDNLNLPMLQRMFSKDFSYDPAGNQLYERLLKLTKIVQEGTKSEFDGFEIKGFKETIFNKAEWIFVQANKLNNSEMVRILFELGFSKSDMPGKKFQQIPYSFFSPRQLGSIYESFLEYTLEKAECDFVWRCGKWEKANLESQKVRSLDIPKVKKGQLFFSPGGSERKATGSFYTPDPIVRFIVTESLTPLTKGKTSKEILSIRVCDPAMGSGHFLSSALNYLASVYLERLERETNDDLSLSLLDAKQLVLHNCIFGVDINPRAVKLAKMSLWLESASAGRALEDLDDQLKIGDSLELDGTFTYKKSFGAVFKQGGFDSIVGNPPWVSFGLRDAGKLDEGKKKLIRERFAHSAEYKISTYALFMELCLRICKEGGTNGLIVPDSFLMGMYFSKVRTYILSNSELQRLVLINGDFWEGACTGFNVIYSLKKISVPKASSVQIHFANGLKDFIEGNFVGRTIKNEFERNNRSRFRLFFDKRVESFVSILEKDSIEIGQFGTVRTGVRSKVGQKNIVSERKEKATYQKGITSGSNVLDYKVSWSGQYINIDPKLLNMGGWNAEVIKQDKVLIRQTADNLISGIDRNGLYHLNNCHSYISDKKDLPIEFICAVLNSKMMRSYYTFISMETGRAMAQIDIEVVERLPIKLPVKAQKMTEIVGIVQKLEKEKDERQREKLRFRLDKEIEVIYGVAEVDTEVKVARHFCLFGDSYKSNVVAA